MNLSVDINTLGESFKRIANELMNEHVIRIKDYYFRIVDCEFYYKHAEKHNDIYTHGHEQQQKNGSWYFHGSGIDITIGNKENNAVGGILLRGIAKLSNKKNANGDFIEVNKKSIGPLNVLTTLFSHFDNVFDKDNSFYLINAKEITGLEFAKTNIYKLPRVGLNIEKDSEGYHRKLYRFISFPYLPHAEKGKAEAVIKNQHGLTDFQAKELFALKYAKHN